MQVPRSESTYNSEQGQKTDPLSEQELINDNIYISKGD